MRERKRDENWNGLLLATLAGCVAVGPTLTWGLIVEGSYAKIPRNLEQNVTRNFLNELYYLSV